MKNCSRCDELPDGIPASGTLYLYAGLEHTTGKIKKTIERAGLSTHTEHRMLKVPYTIDELTTTLVQVRDELSEAEQNDVRVLAVGEEQRPEPEDLIGARSLGDLLGQINGRWLIDMIREGRLFNVFQPIVDVMNPGQVYGYECLLRGRDTGGNVVRPGRIFSTAEDADVVFQLDRQARILAVNNSQEHGIPDKHKLFINFLPTSIYDPEFCLNTTMRAIEDADASPNQFVFEVVESEEVDDREKLIDIISFYREKGLKVALDDFGAGYSSLQMLSDIKPDFLKLDMGLVRKIPENKMNAELCKQILSISSDHNITTLAEGVEQQDQLSWFQEQDLDLAQGYLFARPDLPPPDVGPNFDREPD